MQMLDLEGENSADLYGQYVTTAIDLIVLRWNIGASDDKAKRNIV